MAGAGVVAGLGIARTGVLPGAPASVTAPRPTPVASPSPSSTTTASPPVIRSFVSTALTAPHVASWFTGPTGAGLLFIGPMGHGANGLIMDNRGEPVWMEPTGSGVTDLRVQVFEGQAVLSYWTGTGTGGHGEGKGIIKDTRYRTVAEVNAGNGLQADLHEFTITPAGTALMISYPTVGRDLTSVGGPAQGYIFDCHVQEIGIRSGAVLFDWTASDHVDVSESYLRPSDNPKADGSSAAKAFDPFHLNSVDESGDALLVSSRHTHTAYLVGRPDGDIRWRLGGKRSDFAMTPESVFAWQHDVRRRPNGIISMFDNHYNQGNTGTSRGLLLAVDEKARTAVVMQEFSRGGHRGDAEGNLQFLDNGHVLVGWGADPAATEFTPDGNAVFEATGLGDASYRTYRSPWTGRPGTVPDIAAIPGNGSTMQLYASWNGATEVAKWRFLTGTGPGSMSEAVTVPRRGFETSTAVAAAPRAAVEALDKSGAVLASSAVIATA
ncbi:arylsulfotransferase family protein [Arthrobacter sp. MI7-26]|uniref:arylsulfotransferase family protein n=1 Tax=Arthrobacter sp. MI7-26 TaxID=2993653 RepID=UPI002248CA5E|nr:arylsulfotransferase family protein [Arthrobacter sp. MI7-26]MCX2749054.1 arylsulfotransferase family protein [Arthrobacter sp. MI7-26]